MISPLWALCCLLLILPLGARADRADTTIADQTYALLPAADLLSRLQRAKEPIHLRATAVVGPLYAPTAGIDTVRASFHLDDVFFFDEVTLNNVIFLAPVQGERITFAGGLSLINAHFHSAFGLRASRSDKHLNFKQAVFGADADFADADFAGPNSFINARFAGTARFARTHFATAAYFEGTHFAGQADFTDARFTGVASFKDARWNGPASFAGARFAERALFWRNQFLATTDFAAARADGEISFNRATFADQAHFADFTFAQAAHFTNATFARADFGGSYFRKEADFSGVQAQTLRFNAFFNRSLDLSRAAIGTLDLHPGVQADSTFAASAQLYLQQAYFERLRVRWAHVRHRLATADSVSFAALDPAYNSLRHHFLAQGLKDDAVACEIERLDRQRRALSWAAPKRWGLELWNLCSRYGTAPLQLVLCILGSILLWALVYRLSSSTLRSANGDERPTFADCIGFSIHTFTRTDPYPWYATGKLKLFATFQTLLGWASIGLLLAVILAHLL